MTDDAGRTGGVRTVRRGVAAAALAVGFGAVAVPVSAQDADPSEARVEAFLSATGPVVDMVGDGRGTGYRVLRESGEIVTFGAASHRGDPSGRLGDRAAVAIERMPTGKGDGYWVVARNGRVFAFGDADPQGDLPDALEQQFGLPVPELNAPIVDMAVHEQTGRGYWLVAADGGVFPFGTAGFHGSAADLDLVGPIEAIEPSPSGDGYWLFARDGGVFAFGDAEFAGNPYARTEDDGFVAGRFVVDGFDAGEGYLLVGRSGAVFNYSGTCRGRLVDPGQNCDPDNLDEAFELNEPIIDVEETADGGMWLLGTDGGVFAIGRDTKWFGSVPGLIAERLGS